MRGIAYITFYRMPLPVRRMLARMVAPKSLVGAVTILRDSGTAIRNADLRNDLAALAARVSRAWIIEAVKGVDEIAALMRRNIQKQIALDGLLMQLRRAS